MSSETMTKSSRLYGKCTETFEEGKARRAEHREISKRMDEFFTDEEIDALPERRCGNCHNFSAWGCDSPKAKPNPDGSGRKILFPEIGSDYCEFISIDRLIAEGKRRSNILGQIKPTQE